MIYTKEDIKRWKGMTDDLFCPKCKSFCDDNNNDSCPHSFFDIARMYCTLASEQWYRAQAAEKQLAAAVERAEKAEKRFDDLKIAVFSGTTWPF